MGMRNIKLKLLRIVEHYLRLFADYLLRMTSEPEDVGDSLPDGPPKDWLDRVRRAQASQESMLSHTFTPVPAAGVPQDPYRVPRKRLNVPEAPRPAEDDPAAPDDSDQDAEEPEFDEISAQPAPLPRVHSQR